MCQALHQKMGGHGTIVVDIDPAKREAAKKAGAAHVVDGAAPDAAQQIIELTKGGAWAVIDLVGSSQSARVGYDSLCKGGKYIIVGLYGGDFTISLPPIPMRALTIQGSYVGSQNEMRELMELVRAKGMPDVPVATRPLDDVNAVMDASARRQGSRPRGADAGVSEIALVVREAPLRASSRRANAVKLTPAERR